MGYLLNDQLTKVSADVVKVDMDSLGAGLGQLGSHVPALVVDGCVKAQLVLQEAALLLTAADAHHPRRSQETGHLQPTKLLLFFLHVF